MNEGAVLKRLFGRVVAEYAEFLFYAWDDERREVVGVGHAIPAAWDGDLATLPDGGFDAVMESRFTPGTVGADRPLRAGNHDRSRVSRPGPQPPHDRADGRNRSRPRFGHTDRACAADPEAALSTDSDRPLPLVATAGRHPSRPLVENARAARRRHRQSRLEIRWSSQAPWRSGRNGRRWRFRRAACTSCQVRWCRSRSIVSGTKACTWSRTCGWCTPRLGPPNPRLRERALTRTRPRVSVIARLRPPAGRPGR